MRASGVSHDSRGVACEASLLQQHQRVGEHRERVARSARQVALQSNGGKGRCGHVTWVSCSQVSTKSLPDHRRITVGSLLSHFGVSAASVPLQLIPAPGGKTGSVPEPNGHGQQQFSLGPLWLFRDSKIPVSLPGVWGWHQSEQFSPWDRREKSRGTGERKAAEGDPFCLPEKESMLKSTRSLSRFLFLSCFSWKRRER